MKKRSATAPSMADARAFRPPPPHSDLGYLAEGLKPEYAPAHGVALIA